MGELANTLGELLVRVEAATGPDGMLDRQIALALGWRERRVTKLGLNGRTTGGYRWFEPDYPHARRLPRFTGPRKRAATLQALRALQSQDGKP